MDVIKLKAADLAAQLREVPNLFDTNNGAIRTQKMIAAGSVLMRAFDAGFFHAEAWLESAIHIQAGYRDDPTCNLCWQIGAFRDSVKHFAPDLHPRLADQNDHEGVDEACGRLANVIEAADAQPGKANGDAGMMSCSDLAAKHGVGRAALNNRLQRWRKQHDAGWIEVSPTERGPHGSKYLYRESAVLGVVKG